MSDPLKTIDDCNNLLKFSQASDGADKNKDIVAVVRSRCVAAIERLLRHDRFLLTNGTNDSPSFLGKSSILQITTICFEHSIIHAFDLV